MPLSRFWDSFYGSYQKWDAARYKMEVDKAVAAHEQYPDILAFFQAGNEPPLDDGYVKFHQEFVKDVLVRAPGYQVIGPNKAFNLTGVDPAEMNLYIDKCGSTTDILNWHIYGQPPSMVLSEARYWSDAASGKMRVSGPAKVMFTESDVWNQGDSQYNYLMDRAFSFLPEPRIVGTFTYCMRPRSEGGTYKFGILQPEGEFSANYNGFWIWRDLRGRMIGTTISGAPEDARQHVHAISSQSQDGRTFTTVVYYDEGYFNGPAAEKSDKADLSVKPQLPPGQYNLQISNSAWNVRTVSKAGTGQAVDIELAPFHAAALTWTRQ